MYVYIIIHCYLDRDGYYHEKVSSIYRNYYEAKDQVDKLNSMCFPWDIEWYELDEMWVH